MAQDQQHTAAWLAAANPPPRHAQEDRDQRENQKETDRENVCERTLSAERGRARPTDREEEEDVCEKGELAEQHREKRCQPEGHRENDARWERVYV